MTVEEELAVFADELAQAGSQREKLKALVSLADEWEESSREGFSKEDRMPGCQSDVFLRAWLEDGRVRLSSFTGSLVVRGFVAVVCSVLDGRTPGEVLSSREAFEGFVRSAGLEEVQLTPARTNVFERVFGFLEEKVRRLAS